jgi:hypothetical protein
VDIGRALSPLPKTRRLTELESQATTSVVFVCKFRHFHAVAWKPGACERLSVRELKPHWAADIG